MDSILSSRPEDRRELIEEAAGISKHRRRKERSERKLRSMDEHLTRAKDISREVARQLGPLERQVGKARRQHDLKTQLSDLSTTLAVDNLRQLQMRYNQLTARQREAEAAVELAQWRLDERSRELERYQSLLEQKGIFVGDLGEQRHRMQDILGRLDSDMRLLEEKGKNMVARLSEMRMTLSSSEHQRRDAAAEHERVAEELRDATASAKELQARLDELVPAAKQATERRRALGSKQAQLTADQRSAQRQADSEMLAYAKLRDQIANAETQDQMFASRLSQIEESIATAEEAIEERRRRENELTESLEATTAAADACAAAIREAQETLNRARTEEDAARKRLQEARATLSALEEVDLQSANASELTAAVASSAGDLVECRLADLIEAPDDLEDLVERLLGDDLAALIVADAPAATELAGTAEGLSKTPGRATIIARRPEIEPLEADAPGEPLLSMLTVPDAAIGLVQALLIDVRIVEDAAAAIRAHDAFPTCTYVTRSGVRVLPDGRIEVGASSGAEHGALQRKRRIRALRDSLSSLEDALGGASHAVSDAEAELASERDRSARAKGEVARLKGELTSVTSEIGRLEAQRSQASSEHAQLAKKRSAASQKADEARPQIEQHKAAAEEAEARVAELTRRLDEVGRERSLASREENDASERLADARLRLATIVERRNHLSIREEELSRTLDAIDRRLVATARSARALDVLRLRVDPLHDRYQAIQERALEWSALLQDRSRLAEADSDSLKTTISEAREAVNAASSELERARSAASDIKVDLGRIEVQVVAAL